MTCHDNHPLSTQGSARECHNLSGVRDSNLGSTEKTVIPQRQGKEKAVEMHHAFPAVVEPLSCRLCELLNRCNMFDIDRGACCN